jgi:hypothetical protein
MARRKSPSQDVPLKNFQGINNVQAPERLSFGGTGRSKQIASELREALNVDIDDQQRARRRAGYVKIYTGTDCHSFWASGSDAYFVEGNALQRLNSDFTATALRSDLQTGNRMSYLRVDTGETYYSDGYVLGSISGTGTASEWGLETPQLPSLSATAGSLPAGRYSVTVSVQTSAGTESGARASATIDLASDGGILFSNLPNDSNADFVNIYMTPWNGDVLYLAKQVAMGTTSTTVTNTYDLTRQVPFQHMDRPIAGKFLEYYNGRIYFAVGNILYWTLPFAYHIVDYRENFVQFPEDITDVAAVDDGLYVGADKTYFLGGDKPQDFTVKDVTDDVIVSYTMVVVPASKVLKEGDDPVVVWTGHRGVWVGGPGGQITNITEDRYVPKSATEGTAVIRDRDGSDQYAALLKDQDGSPEGIYASDVAVAEVYRNGVLVQ